MTSKLFSQIEATIPKMHGWCDLPKAFTLASIVIALRPRIIVEIGVWGGRSLLPMALACKETGCGFVHAIDPWTPEASVVGQPDEHAKWWESMPHELVYQSYLKHISDAGVGAIVATHRMTSDEALKQFKGMTQIQLAHIDGNHAEQALRDIQNYCPLVSKGGIVVLDDISWSGGNVQKGADWMLKNGFVGLYPLGTGAVFLKL